MVGRLFLNGYFNIFIYYDTKIQSGINNLNKVNQFTSIYHAHDIVDSGKRYIVARMSGINYNKNDELYHRMTDVEVNFQIILSRFVSGLARSQQKQFGEVMEYISKIYCRNVIQPICHVPEHYADLRRMYVDGEHSIAKQLPIPDIKLVSCHSTVSIVDVIADFLLKQKGLINDVYNYDNIVEKINNMNNMHIFKTVRVQEIISNAKMRLSRATNQHIPIIPIFIIIWSDDFDPNKSIKNNRQSVWIKTTTIFTIDMNGEKISSTYPLTLSLKGMDHDVVDSMYEEQIKKLMEGELIIMYSRSHKSLVHVHGEIFCVLNDQPERRGNLKLANGNSMIHGRFGYLIDCRQVINGIRSCVTCSQSVIEEATSTSISKLYQTCIIKNIRTY
jgi:hypothetical protein